MVDVCASFSAHRPVFCARMQGPTDGQDCEEFFLAASFSFAHSLLSLLDTNIGGFSFYHSHVHSTAVWIAFLRLRCRLVGSSS